jgi:hypothetical protein
MFCRLFGRLGRDPNTTLGDYLVGLEPLPRSLCRDVRIAQVHFRTIARRLSVNLEVGKALFEYGPCPTVATEDQAALAQIIGTS